MCVPLCSSPQVNLPDHLGQTPLHIAARLGLVGVARFLLANGGDPEAKTAADQDVEQVRGG